MSWVFEKGPNGISLEYVSSVLIHLHCKFKFNLKLIKNVAPSHTYNYALYCIIFALYLHHYCKIHSFLYLQFHLVGPNYIETCIKKLIMQNPTILFFQKKINCPSEIYFSWKFSHYCVTRQVGNNLITKTDKFHHHSRSDQHPRYQGQPDTLVVGESECGNSSPEGFRSRVPSER